MVVICWIEVRGGDSPGTEFTFDVVEAFVVFHLFQFQHSFRNCLETSVRWSRGLRVLRINDSPRTADMYTASRGSNRRRVWKDYSEYVKEVQTVPRAEIYLGHRRSIFSKERLLGRCRDLRTEIS